MLTLWLYLFHIAQQPVLQIHRYFGLYKKVTFKELLQIAKNTEKNILKSVNLFDVYEGDKLAEGEVSYAISLTLQDPERTLNEKQIEQSVERILNKIAEETGARLRD